MLAVALPAAFAAPAKVLFNKVKIELRQETPPEPNLKTTGTTGSSQKLVNPHWLLIRVDFIPGQSGATRNTWCDDIELAIRAVCPGPGAKEYTAFTGVTKFWTIRLDGRTHTALMAIPPHLLDRYVSAAPGLSGSAVSVAKSQFRVEALFRDSSGVILGRGYFGGDAGEFTRAFRAAGQRVVEGAVLPRDLTPWRYQPQAYYDIIRPEGVAPTRIPESAGGPPARGTVAPGAGRKPPRKGADR